MTNVGNTMPLESLIIQSTGATTLNGLITTDGDDAADGILLHDAADVRLGSNVSLVSAELIRLDAVNNLFDLSAQAGGNLTVEDAIGGTTPLDWPKSTSSPRGRSERRLPSKVTRPTESYTTSTPRPSVRRRTSSEKSHSL